MNDPKTKRTETSHSGMMPGPMGRGMGAMGRPVEKAK